MTTRNTFLRLCCPPGPNAVRWTARVGPAEVGRELCTHLQGLGIRVWFDEVVIEPGASQALQTDRGLAKAHCGIALLTPAYLAGHQSFLIGINAGHFNDTDSQRANDHAGLSRMHKLSAIMEILRANTVPSAGAPSATLLIPKDGVDAYGGFPADYFSQESESSPDDSDSRDESIMALRREGKSLRTIAAEVGCSATTVGRVIKRHS